MNGLFWVYGALNQLARARNENLTGRVDSVAGLC
jgi:hypothetical protein